MNMDTRSINQEINIDTGSINQEINMDNSSSTLIDVIDLTKESPKQSHHRCNENASTSYTTRCITRRNPLPPIILGSREDIQVFNFASVAVGIMHDIMKDNEIVNLDNTIEIIYDKEEERKQEDKSYTFQSDNKMPVSLTCPICFEILSSRLKPTTTRCGHLFCEKCLKESIRTYKHCPTCKRAITLKSCIRLYL